MLKSICRKYTQQNRGPKYSNFLQTRFSRSKSAWNISRNSLTIFVPWSFQRNFGNKFKLEKFRVSRPIRLKWISRINNMNDPHKLFFIYSLMWAPNGKHISPRYFRQKERDEIFFSKNLFFSAASSAIKVERIHGGDIPENASLTVVLFHGVAVIRFS